jgi:tetratricopeptide (TPR) repeat protein
MMRDQFFSRSISWLFIGIIGWYCLIFPTDRAFAATEIPDWFRSGVVHLQRGDYTDALHHFTRAIERGTNPGAAYGNRCLVRIHLGDYVNAWQDCTRSLQHRSNSLAYLHRGLAFYRLGENDRAIADYDRALQLRPTDYRAYYNRGLVRVARGDYSGALTDFNQSLRQIAPLDPVALAAIYSDRGFSHLASGNIAAAGADIARALDLDPDHARAYYHRACLHRQLQRLPEAIDDLNRALALDPDLTDARVQRGLSFYQLGYARPALEDLQRGAKELDRRGLSDHYRSVIALIGKIQKKLSVHANLVA